MNAQLKKGVLELLVLSEISRHDEYGYELSQNISKYISIADGTLYPLLRRLVVDGFLDTYLGKTSGGPARKYYTLTDLGRNRFDELMEEWESLVSSVEQITHKEMKKDG